MTQTVFYVWQSDTSVNRSFIRDALKGALKELRGEGYDVEPDEAANSETGSPEITRAILNSIERSSVVLCDITPVAKTSKGKLIANPNVMFEHGWAMRSLGSGRVITANNEAFGTLEEAPFDVRHRRQLAFTRHAKTKPGDTKPSQLKAGLRGRIRDILDRQGAPVTSESVAIARSIASSVKASDWTAIGIDVQALGHSRRDELLMRVGRFLTEYSGGMPERWGRMWSVVKDDVRGWLADLVEPARSPNEYLAARESLEDFLNGVDLHLHRLGGLEFPKLPVPSTVLSIRHVRELNERLDGYLANVRDGAFYPARELLKPLDEVQGVETVDDLKLVIGHLRALQADLSGDPVVARREREP